MKLVLLNALIIGTLIACKPQTTTTSSNTTSTTASNSACTIGKWSSSNFPITLKLSSEFTNEFTSSNIVNGYNPLERAANTWNAAISGKTFFTTPFSAASTTGYTNSNSFNDSEMGIYKSHTWFSDVSSNALAITQYYGYLRSDSSLGSYIDLTHADIIMNYRDFGSQFNYLGVTYDVQTIILHEMGHFLGLCHETTKSNGSPISIMYPSYLGTRRTLYTFDITKITDLYVNNRNTLASSSNYSASNAITLPEGTFVKGHTELLKDGQCKHYIGKKLVYEHYVDLQNKKGPGETKAFYKILNKFKKLF